MFDSLGFKFQGIIQKLRGQKKITEGNIEATLAEIRRQLLESDVSLKAVKLFISRVKENALGQEVLTGINPGEQFIKIINDSLIEVLGGKLSEEERELNLTKKPSVILLLGLQGAGKTTAAAKLALKLKSEGRNPLLVPADLQRPAAVKQLKILAEQAGVDFLNIINDDAQGTYKISSPVELSNLLKNLDQQKSTAGWIATSPSAPRNDGTKHDIYIIDTAGRLQIDTDLMAELLILEKQLEPSEKLLVIDSLIGQEAANVADTFNTQIGITGIILTKLDSDTRGGAALSVVEATGKAIKLASVGEKLEDLENFYPERMASRILGMGDVISLVEKTQQKISEEESKRLEEELMKGNFNYETFLSFQNMISKIGNFGSIFKMLGMGQFLSGMGLDPNNQDALLEQGQNKLSRYKIAINSMTKQERTNPDLLSTHSSSSSRKKRIAKGSGLKDTDIAQLSSEFSKMSKVFKNMGPMMSMMKASQGAEEMAGKFNPQQAMFNPKQMLEQMSSGLSKKQRQALNQINPGLTNSAKKLPQIKKGEKPQVKGFRD